MRVYDQNTQMNPKDSLNAVASHAVRGGSWITSVYNVRAACRGKISPNDPYDRIGFRCARVRGEPGQPAG